MPSPTAGATASDAGSVSSRVPSQEEEDRKTMEETLGQVSDYGDRRKKMTLSPPNHRTTSLYQRWY